MLVAWGMNPRFGFVGVFITFTVNNSTTAVILLIISTLAVISVIRTHIVIAISVVMITV